MTLRPDLPRRLASFIARRRTVLGLALLFVAYDAFILAPIVARLASGHAFGGDVAEYLLASGQILGRNPTLYHYYFPALPVLYLPLTAANLGYVPSYAIADTLSGAIAIALFVGSGYLGYAVGRSATAAAVGAGTIGTSFVILNEIGWGGQAQMLSFAFGVSAIAVLLGGKIRGWPARTELVAGLLLAGAALSEAYAAAFFVLLAVTWCVLTERRALFAWAAAKKFWPIPLLPLLALGVATALGGSAAAPTVSDPILFHALTARAWQEAIAGANIGNAVNGYCYAVLVAAFAVFAALGAGWSRRVAYAVLASLAACFVEVFLLTPAVYWDRAPYFVMFPLAIMAAGMASGLPRALRPPAVPSPPERRPRWRAARRRRWVDTACAVVAVGVVVAQTAITFDLYPQILRFYTVDPSALAELTWLRSEPGAVLMVAPEGQIFPVSYATGRTVFPWTQPVWFDIASEQQAAILATMLVSGRQWISAGSLRVVDTGSPTNTTSPGIFGYRYPYLVKLFDVFEGQGAAPESPSGSGATVRASSVSVARTDGAGFEDVDTLASYTVDKVTSVAPNGTVTVNLTYDSGSATPGPAYVGLQMPLATLRSDALGPAGGRVVESFLQPGSTEVSYASAIGVSAPANETVGAPTLSSASGYPAFYWPVSPGTGFAGSTLRLSLTIDPEGLAVAPPVVVGEASAMADNGIQWVLLDSATDASLAPRFNLDPEFAIDWTSPTYTVYRVG